MAHNEPKEVCAQGGEPVPENGPPNETAAYAPHGVTPTGVAYGGTEYAIKIAPSGRAKCKSCKEFIAQGEVKFISISSRGEYATEYGDHLDGCTSQRRLNSAVLRYGSIENVNIPGVEHQTFATVQMIQDLIDGEPVIARTPTVQPKPKAAATKKRAATDVAPDWNKLVAGGGIRHLGSMCYSERLLRATQFGAVREERCANRKNQNACAKPDKRD